MKLFMVVNELAISIEFLGDDGIVRKILKSIYIVSLVILLAQHWARQLKIR